MIDEAMEEPFSGTAGPGPQSESQAQERPPAPPEAGEGRNGREGSAGEAHAPQPYYHEEWRPAGEHFKSIPDTKERRLAIRQAAVPVAARLSRQHPPSRAVLQAAAREVLLPLGYDDSYLGFAMVMVNNEYWRDEFAAVPFEKRLFSLPHCLKQAEHCTAKLDEVQLHCNNCGLCSIADFDQLGRRIGYNVLVAEGTPVVLRLIASGEVEGILGIACLNVLEKSFERVLQIGIPALAIPLLRDTCHNTEVDEDWVLEALGYQRTGAPRTRSFVPLLREMVHEFDPKPFKALAPEDRARMGRKERVAETERLSMAWMRKGGKRFRPFLTAAAWQALSGEDQVPHHVKRVAAGMEFVHKASLIHDDIEDDDDFRYGTQTLHRSHSVPVALNIGDYLLGRGYRIVHEVGAEIGMERVGRIMGRLAQAHVKLAEGQGAELLWRKAPDKRIPPLDCLKLYALKTAPAFAAALQAGAILATTGEFPWERELDEFSKHLGVAYQIQNDLKDMAEGPENKVNACGDIQKGRPTLLFALALEAADETEGAELLQAARDGAASAVGISRIQEIYYRHEIPLQAALFAERQKERALQAVQEVAHPGLQALFTFLAATLLD